MFSDSVTVVRSFDELFAVHAADKAEIAERQAAVRLEKQKAKFKLRQEKEAAKSGNVTKADGENKSEQNNDKDGETNGETQAQDTKSTGENQKPEIIVTKGDECVDG